MFTVIFWHSFCQFLISYHYITRTMEEAVAAAVMVVIWGMQNSDLDKARVAG